MSGEFDLRRPLPRHPGRLSFVAALAVLTPLAAMSALARGGLHAPAPWTPAGGLLAGVQWSLWEPGRMLPRVQALVLDHFGVGPSGVPVVGLLLGAIVLALATVAPATTRTSPRRRLAAGVALALAPGFLLAVTIGAPVLWGLIAWMICTRSMGPCEGRENIQQEMSLAFGLALMMFVEPLSWLLILPTVVGLPLLLRRSNRPATTAAVALCVIPPILTFASAVLALSFLREDSPLTHFRRWTSSLSTTDPAVPLVVIGPPLLTSMLLVAVPTIVLLGLALRDTRRRHHPMALVLGAGAPTLCMALMAATGHADSARILGLYAVAGQTVWLAQTPVPRTVFRIGIVAVGLGLVGQYVL